MVLSINIRGLPLSRPEMYVMMEALKSREN